MAGTDPATWACTAVYDRVDARAITAGLIPLAAVVAVDPSGWYPFGPAKFAAVAVAVLSATAVCFWHGVVPISGRPARAMAWTWAFLIGWLSLAAVFGVDPWYAWIGTPERRLGVFTWVLFALAAWIGTQLARQGRALTSLRRAAVLATVWCGGYGLMEWWWRSPIPTASATDRLGGPFGSAAYFGAALCLFLPVATGVAIDGDERRGWRIVAGVGAVAGTMAVIGTGTRAAWVGLVAAAVVLVLARRPSVRWVVVGIAVVAVGAALAGPRVVDVTERSAPWSSRVDEWEVAVRTIAARPAIGAGPEGYRIVMAGGVDGGYERTYGRDALPDRTHSAPLDVAAIGGAPAAAAYLVLLAVSALAVWRALRPGPAGSSRSAHRRTEIRGDAVLGPPEQERTDRAAGSPDIAVAVVAYGIQQLFLFPIAELDPTWWLFIGTLAALGLEPRVDDPPDATQQRSRPRRRGPAAAVAGLACAVFAAGVVEVAADRAARTALDRGSAPHARRAAALRPDVVRYHLLEASFGAGAQSLTGVDDEIAAVRRAAGVSPNDPIVRRSLANALGHRAAVTGDADDVATAVDAWIDLVADDPHCGACWYELGAIELLSGNGDEAVSAWRRAAELGGDSAAAAELGLASLNRGAG